ncbi:hypothetical protein ACJ5H2_01310 [Nocardioides sp. R1-1]|uniref:hypothetical protein n=1 Tax=Nocardioides sp. R1-1 TaxID=3383502 RepID=UPI0038D227D0
MTAQLGDPAVEYWTSAMASVREVERRHRRAGAGSLVLGLVTSTAVAVTGYLGAHLRAIPARRSPRSSG